MYTSTYFRMAAKNAELVRSSSRVRIVKVRIAGAPETELVTSTTLLAAAYKWPTYISKLRVSLGCQDTFLGNGVFKYGGIYSYRSYNTTTLSCITIYYWESCITELVSSLIGICYLFHRIQLPDDFEGENAWWLLSFMLENCARRHF